MQQYSKDQKKKVKEAYDRLPFACAEERETLLAQIREIRQQVEGKALFSDDIEHQKLLASQLGLKGPFDDKE